MTDYIAIKPENLEKPNELSDIVPKRIQDNDPKPKNFDWEKGLVSIALVSPLALNALMFVLAFYFFSGQNPEWRFAYPICMASFLATVGSLLVTIRGFYSRYLEVGLAILSAVLSTLLFAYVYSIFGLKIGNEVTRRFIDCLYFSIVTTTTLGYGDLTAQSELKMLSAIQSLLGYVYLGFMISFVSGWASATIRRDRIASKKR